MKTSPLIFVGALGLGLALWSRSAHAYTVPQFTAQELALYLNSDGTINLPPSFKPAQNSDGDVIPPFDYSGVMYGLRAVPDYSDMDLGSWQTEYEYWVDNSVQSIINDPVLVPEDELSGAYEMDMNGLFRAVADWLSREESFVGYIYDDATGKPWTQSRKGNPTIGIGHLVTRDDFARYGEGWTLSQQEAYDLLLSDINRNLAPVLRAVNVPLTLKQWIAITSLAFNAGGNGVANSQFIKAVNAKDMQRAELQFKDWNKSSVSVDGQRIKRVNRGLVARRAREWDIFTTPDQVVMLTNGPAAG